MRTKTLHLRGGGGVGGETREDRAAWLEALWVTKDMFPRMSSSKVVGPGDSAAAAAVSTERLRQRLQQEGVSETAIADSERIVQAEFESLKKQALLLETHQDLGKLRVTEVVEAPLTFNKSLNEWRNYLCDINFWLDGYLKTPAYRYLEDKLDRYVYVQWNVGVRATTCFARAISSIARDSIIKRRGPFDHVIEVDMKHEAVLGRILGINAKLAIIVAEQLGLLDQEHYRRLKADVEEPWYYSYGLEDGRVSSHSNLKVLAQSLVSQIIEILTTKRYLAVVENLDEPIETNILGNRRVKVLLCFPAPQWKDTVWLISATSKDVYNKSKLPYDCLIGPSSGQDMVILTLYSLHQAAKYILGAIGHKDEQYWNQVAVRCFHYATMLLVPHCRSSSHHGDGGQQSYAGGRLANDITSDELIRQWSAQGILVIDTERTGETIGSSSSYDGNYSDIYQVGNVILEAFREYSLLPQLPFSLSPATTEAEEATKSAAHFLACHNLIAEHHTIDELCDGENPARLERMQWILHVGDQGWHLSREWLSDGASGPTTLILRYCSQQSKLLAKLDYLLAKLPYLCVLDLSYSSVESLPPSVSCLQILKLLYLSYTPLKSLPPSIFYLQKLQYLSLRGCYNMTSPFGFITDTDDIITTTLPAGNNGSDTEIIGLLHLDLSYSNVKTFHCDFFRRMPNLQELLLLKCSNLEELPSSIAALSSLEKLELRGTQIKSFPGKMFEDMKKLRSVKIIENKELLSAPAGLFSKASGLTNLHIEGCESITDVEVVTLERHPTLRSFSFIGAPHMKRLSLHGCRKLEYVDIKEVGALEELDLSATAIKELPDNIPNLPKLRRLLLMDVPSLRRFPWHKLARFPDVFCLDQCSNSTINHSDHPHAAQVCIISDSRLFYSFSDGTRDLVRAAKLLKTFYVRVTSSCKFTARKMQDEEDMVMTNTLQLAPPAYDDVTHRYLTAVVSVVSMDDVPPFQGTLRHVEIPAADQYPYGLEYLLAVTKSISMWDDAQVFCLNDLSSYLDELEECKLRWCHKMVHVFEYRMKNLKNAYVSHLKILTLFYRPPSSGFGFNLLKHLVLAYCPRLEGVFPGDCELASLETLDILFCYNLKAIFYNRFPQSYSGGYKLPCLRRIRLQELPLLEHLHVNHNPIVTAPAWEELHIRGCWSLRRLPCFRRQPHKAVKVSGERAWWDKLCWDWDGIHSHHGSYEPMLPPAFASHRERIVIESYLR